MTKTTRLKSVKQLTNRVENKKPDTDIDAEIKQAIFSMAGKWADRDDITEDWVENMRQQSDDRLADILNLD